MKKAGILDFAAKNMIIALKQAEALLHTIQKDAESIAYYSDVEGTGAFSSMAAAACAAHIKHVILTGKQIPGVSQLAKYSKRYGAQKRELGRGYHYLSGDLADNVYYSVLKGVGSITMLDAQVEGRSITMNTLADYLERGTKAMPARPLMHLAANDFIATKMPLMVHTIRKDIYKSIMQNHKHLDNPVGAKSAQSLAVYNVQAHFKFEDPFKGGIAQRLGKGKAQTILNAIGSSQVRLNKWVS